MFLVSGLIAILLMLVLVIGLHEAAHAFAARLFDVKIQRISLGFGKPVMLWRNKNGCEWVWATWPIGGYVQLLNTRIQKVDKKDYPQCFDKKPAWVRIVILLAGAIANFLVAIIALILFYMIGHQQQPPIIAQVVPDSIAAQAGIVAQDRFIAINGQAVSSWQEAGTQLIIAFGQDNVQAEVADAQTSRKIILQLNGPLVKNSKNLIKALGIAPIRGNEYVHGEPLFTSIKLAFNKSMQSLWFFVVIIKQLVTGALPMSLLLGPIGLLTVSIESYSQGISVFLYFIASLSLAVGLVNLFPLPVLDGGSIVLTIIEKIRGKPVSVAFEVLLYRLALILFCVFMVQLLLNDLLRL